MDNIETLHDKLNRLVIEKKALITQIHDYYSVHLEVPLGMHAKLEVIQHEIDDVIDRMALLSFHWQYGKLLQRRYYGPPLTPEERARLEDMREQLRREDRGEGNDDLSM